MIERSVFIMLKDEYKVYEEKMKKSIESVAADFASVRAGRANASVLDRILVDYYGSPTPIQQIAAISSPDPRTLLISPWDGSALKLIEKAIQNSDLGINPQNDGKALRLAFPQLTEERRKELVKQIRKYAEGGKVAVRNIRRDAMDNFKKQEKQSEITEDELKMVEKDLQKLTDDSCKALDDLLGWLDAHGLDRLKASTQIMITPLDYRFRIVRNIVTNFHQPKSTLLLLVSAYAGERWREIYDYALAHDFRFLSYGDSSVLMR